MQHNKKKHKIFYVVICAIILQGCFDTFSTANSPLLKVSFIKEKWQESEICLIVRNSNNKTIEFNYPYFAPSGSILIYYKDKENNSIWRLLNGLGSSTFQGYVKIKAKDYYIINTKLSSRYLDTIKGLASNDIKGVFLFEEKGSKKKIPIHITWE